MGMEDISLDFDEKFKPDILTDILEWDYKGWFEKYKFTPDFIWASPPCNTFSPLAYPFKERNPQTATPYSERAKLGTKILYKTLEIIDYFKKLNPKLLFVIENPKGMMRKDKQIKKLNIATTTYCAYGDIKKKLTDFFNNVPDNLKLKEIKKCPNSKKIISVVDLKLEDRYSIPPRLVRDILKQLIENY